MRNPKILVGLILATAMLATPAQAGWKLVTKQEAVKVAKGSLTVTPGEDWNRSSARPVKRSEVWTLDGAGLNELYFISGLTAGETLFSDTNKKEAPLPTMDSSMLLTDIPDFYESSSRIAMQTSLFEIEQVQPVTFAGQPGVKFTFNYGVQNSPVIRKGMAVGTLVKGQLHLISFVAPSIHYFQRDTPKVQAIIDSATL